MAVTVKDIANLAGVSIATVSRVTNEAGNVSHETRSKVLWAISTLQYCPNPTAAQLARRSSGVPRNGKSRNSAHRDAGLTLRSEPIVNGDSGRVRAERLRMLERENRQLKRQVSTLLTDLERWQESLKVKLGT
jgi:hypothetical protein